MIRISCHYEFNWKNQREYRGACLVIYKLMWLTFVTFIELVYHEIYNSVGFHSSNRFSSGSHMFRYSRVKTLGKGFPSERFKPARYQYFISFYKIMQMMKFSWKKMLHQQSGTRRHLVFHSSQEFRWSNSATSLMNWKFERPLSWCNKIWSRCNKNTFGKLIIVQYLRHSTDTKADVITRSVLVVLISN